jgi:hypothetical protein
VVFSLVINSVIDKGPVIFLRWSEGYHGELDAYVYPNGVYHKDNVWKNLFFNYTRVHELYNTTYNIAARKFLGSSVISEL